ncbi:MAG TPA: cell division protein FtsL [Kofleriaceae bacterium]|nr:cell division protein FtsL [Kofleriaceae bacterium]
MTSPGAASVYRIFKRSDGAASVRSVVIAMALVACVLTGLGVVRVTRQHEVLALGYQLDREAEHLRQQKEINRRLQVELATQSSPDRVRRLAAQLGMTPVPPDRIRIIDVPSRKKVAAAP